MVSSCTSHLINFPLSVYLTNLRSSRGRSFERNNYILYLYIYLAIQRNICFSEISHRKPNDKILDVTDHQTSTFYAYCKRDVLLSAIICARNLTMSSPALPQKFYNVSGISLVSYRAMQKDRAGYRGACGRYRISDRLHDKVDGVSRLNGGPERQFSEGRKQDAPSG